MCQRTAVLTRPRVTKRRPHQMKVMFSVYSSATPQTSFHWHGQGVWFVFNRLLNKWLLVVVHRGESTIYNGKPTQVV